MQRSTLQPRMMFCGLLIALSLLSQSLAWHSAGQISAGREQCKIVACDDAELTSVSVKDSSELFRLTRRHFTNELWQAVVVPSSSWLASYPARSYSSHQILCEFARRELAGVLLS
jgi:hypothetical protein